MAREIKVYTFDELSEEAKKTAIDSMRDDVANNLNSFDADDFRATVKEVCDVFNAKSSGRYWTDLHYRGDNYDEYVDEGGNETAETVRKFVEDRLTWADIDIKKDYPFTGVFSDDAACKYIEQVLKGEKVPESIDEFIKELGEEIHYQWEQQEDANSDDEVVAEFLSANGYDFLESGAPLKGNLI